MTKNDLMTELCTMARAMDRLVEAMDALIDAVREDVDRAAIRAEVPAQEEDEA
jgi:Xaa-Pro aminopeptidase